LGGYSPIRLDITEALKPGGNELVVYARDDSRAGSQPSGKQSPRLHSFGCMYTRVTGIWQTVWLEAVSAAHITHFTVVASARDARAVVTVELARLLASGTVHAEASFAGSPVASAQASAEGTKAVLCLDIAEPRPWGPGSPNLYDLTLRLTQGGQVLDEVRSYFGLRDVDIDGPRILLNGRVTFLRLILDQGYYPGGVYTAESEEVLRRDIELAQSMGFTGARLHQKVFEPRFLYWADRLGYLLCGEMGDWGLDFGDTEGRENFAAEWLEVLRRDINHPSIIIWTPFNETTRGLAAKARLAALEEHIYRLTKAVDPTRPVIDTSGYVHVATDIYDIHNYTQDLEKFAALFARFGQTGASEDAWRNVAEHNLPYGGQPYFVSEYGGTWWVERKVAGNAWGYGERPRTKAELLARFRALTEILLRNPRIAGFCYTQLTDIEQETNGLLTFGRKYKLDAKKVRAIVSQPAAIERT
jgi:beta-galactosidase/beta-glucuronidase